jgi:hypothetical protein
MSKNAKTKDATLREQRIFSVFLIITAVGFLTFALAVAGEIQSLFWPFVLLPGIIGVANYIVTLRQRDAEHEADQTTPEQAAEAEGQHRPTFIEAMAAALLLTAVFSVAAKAAAKYDDIHLRGLTYAGYGAYISTLWFMLVRLNASALSPRFLINSALKASIAMLIGYVASANDIFKSDVAIPTICFFVGLFLSIALKALKRTAMATFGVTQQAGPADLSVRLLEGVDDGAVDVLEELGITSVQHLATMHSAEVCGRSLYPRYRVLDWIDQSILAVHTNGRISDLRAIGIRSAYGLITIADDARTACAEATAASKKVAEAEQRLGLPPGGLQLVAKCISTDPGYVSLKLAYDRKSPDPRAADTGDATASVPSAGTDPHLMVREQQQPRST